MHDCQWVIDYVDQRPDRDAILARLPRVVAPELLAQQGDDRLLSDLCRRVFRAGLKHSLVDAKWPAFEQAFHGFDPQRIVLMSDEQLEALMQNGALIRHWGKLKSVRHNAQMVCELAMEHGSFARFIAAWPGAEIVGLWSVLKQQGAHLGGQSGAAFLRLIGKDTFRLSPDVVAALKAQQVVDRMPTSKRDLGLVQQAFNRWHDQSGLPLSHISHLLAHTVGTGQS
ncbi:DNA-3-methyladenine glycosylase I [Motiliproteus sediminis]|uniref:DNA-3-methyladenine glycosylase I n=1 Tax=Motiliproteus sediminis TaxID=1468178 RepID=UPI001AF02832|nr:DNA-3-methyladenine glycosylase I [Motiliproteus sediminis]